MGHGSHGKRLGHGDLVGEDFEEGLGHTMPISVLWNVFMILVGLTIVTVAVSRVNFGHWNIFIALFIATVKATIVACWFMHLKFEGKTIIMYVFYPLVVLFLFIGGSMVDVATRAHVEPLGIPAKLPEPVIAGPEHNPHDHSPSAGAHSVPPAASPAAAHH